MRTKKLVTKAKTTVSSRRRPSLSSRTVLLRLIPPPVKQQHPIRLALVALVAFLTLSATGGVVSAQQTTDFDALYQHIELLPSVASDALFTPSSYLSNDIREWTPMPGDKFEVNVETNMGRLIHTNGESVEFEVVTGVRRVVRYIGRRYYAATPAAEWIVRETVIKKDRWTFGKSGRFIRLYKVDSDGNEISTAYGIHPFGREDAMFRVPGRYGSMGCIILRESMEDIIQQTIRVNGGEMKVRTFPDMSEE